MARLIRFSRNSLQCNESSECKVPKQNPKPKQSKNKENEISSNWTDDTKVKMKKLVNENDMVSLKGKSLFFKRLNYGYFEFRRRL